MFLLCGAHRQTMSDLGDFASHDPEALSEEPTTGESNESESDDNFTEYDVNPAGQDYGIGTLSAAEGLMVSERVEDTRLRAYITVENRSQVRIGRYLLAPYPDGERLFCRIVSLEYAQEFQTDDATEIHARRAMRRDQIDEQDYKFIANLEPVAVLYKEGETLKRRMTDRVPKPETVLREAVDPKEIKTGLKIPSSGIFLGHLAVGGETVKTAAEPPTIDYRLRDGEEIADPLIFRHTLVAGGTGSGKTHTAKNIIRQFLAPDQRYRIADGREVAPAVVIIDPQDEYAQMHDDNDELRTAHERQLEQEGITYGGHTDTIALVPKVGDATYATAHHRAEQIEFTIPFAMVEDNPWLIAGSALNDNQYSALRYLLKRFFGQYGDGGTYQDFATFLSDQALRDELDDSGRIHEATFDAVRRRIRGFGPIFDGDAQPITDLVTSLVRPGGLTTIPTYHINDSRAAATIVLAVSSLMIDQKLSNNPTYDRIKETPIILGMDEAHNFLTNAESVQDARVIGKFAEAAKQGRKERLGLFLITQDPQDIADPIFKQINTTIVLNLGDEDAIKAVNIPSSLESKVPYMETGQMVVYSPDNSEPVELQGLPVSLIRHGRK